MNRFMSYLWQINTRAGLLLETLRGMTDSFEAEGQCASEPDHRNISSEESPV